mmetsp:Transcript_2310/g.3825  ORF Transcript_2310/g.3825 Transcript_2310/m.3825 type:complete len:144 (-) Transcript_2310:271-702(-)|eukprot:CAMPEP_0119108964 /NCGR_PEP_ID=MMETSP1180-20130426/16510_1 /TAXON_ID=3052 ORGANISM="Chlamydomonas cf sp, Strain CCMP681" /NCGR_SAMPLE_ID=MMETSP1180 /ASSEMBLY_ACC=CAM_ASM_000741 /LENGTH=143 /DNA_ID=CAMNT_0007094653 /DNA_START=39 /DNA_END=470 /DNA_ORIENTATION=+
MQTQQQAADAALEALHCTVRDVTMLCTAIAAEQSEPPSAAQLQAMRQQCVTSSLALRANLPALFDVRAQAQAVQGISAPVQEEDDPVVLALRAKRDALVAEVCAASETEAMLMSRTRLLLNALHMWRGHKSHLESVAKPVRGT